MARNFVAASSMSISSTSPPVTQPAYTMAAWFKNNVSGNQAIMSLSINSAADKYDVLRTSGATVIAETFDGVFNPQASASGSVTTGTWTHACGVWAAGGASRIAYRDGGNSGSDATATTLFTANKLSLGMIARGGAGDTYFMNGDIADAGLWSVALDAAEIAALAKGVCPLLIRPQSLVGYWPVTGNDSPELDRWRGSVSLTLSNTPTKSDSPRIYRPVGTF